MSLIGRLPTTSIAFTKSTVAFSGAVVPQDRVIGKHIPLSLNYGSSGRLHIPVFKTRHRDSVLLYTMASIQALVFSKSRRPFLPRSSVVCTCLRSCCR